MSIRSELAEIDQAVDDSVEDAIELLNQVDREMPFGVRLYFGCAFTIDGALWLWKIGKEDIAAEPVANSLIIFASLGIWALGVMMIYDAGKANAD